MTLSAGSEYKGLMGILPDGSKIAPTSHAGGIHGTRFHHPSDVFVNGLPPRGGDADLLGHVNGNPQTAFRGATTEPVVCTHPDNQAGAVFWAEEGGWVYEIVNVPTWDLNKELEGKVPIPGGYGGNPKYAELESAIPAEVATYRIVRAGQVSVHRNFLRVEMKSWQKNPNF